MSYRINHQVDIKASLEEFEKPRLKAPDDLKRRLEKANR
jgi:hypothetical protein